MKKLLAILISASILSVSAQSQLMEESWRTYSVLSHSGTSSPSFAPGNRYLFSERSSYPGPEVQRLVCADGQGVRLWEFPFSPSQFARRILSTNDGRIHITTDRGVNGLITLDLNGNLLWTYSLTAAPDFRLIDCRIFGSDLLVVGVGRANSLTTSPRTILVSLDRFTGAEKYKREYLINGAAFTGEHQLRSAGGSAFIIANRSPSGTGVLKVDPASGDVIASFVTAPFTASYGEVDSTGQLYLSGSDPLTGNEELRKVNGSGTGAMPLVYRKLGVRGGPLILSKGYVYLNSWPTILKLRPSDGATLWQKPVAAMTEFASIAADSTGRLYASLLDWSTPVFQTWLVLIDPNSGNDLETIRIGEGQEAGCSAAFALNSYGEVLVTGGIRPGQLDSAGLSVLYYSPMEPVDDVYSVAQGESLQTSGNGVMANDRYTNPSATWVQKVNGSGPAKGRLVLSANGELFYEAKHNGNLIAPGPQVFRYRTVRQGVSREAQVTINVTRGLISFTLVRYSIAGAGSISGKVVLSSSGPAGTVLLSDNSPYVSVPATVTVPANTVLGTFNVDCLEVSASTAVTLTATHETSTRTLGLTLNRIALSSIVGTTQVVGGNNAGVDVFLNGRAGPGGVDVVVTENSPYVLAPATVHVPEGELTGTGVIPTLPPPTTHNVMITLTYGGEERRFFLKLIKP